MRLFLGIIFSLLVFSNGAFAALAQTTVWEVEQNATASDVNGGGYNPSNASPGTDFSKQATAQFAFSDLATTNGTTNPCVVTSASHNFTSTDNGNLIHIASGGTFTADWYEIVSTAGNAATLDKACASGASTSSGVWKEGGALSWQAASTATWAGKVTAGNTIWIKYSATAYTFTTSIAITDGTVTKVGLIAGYNATRGDNPIGANRPVLNLAGTSNTFSAYNLIQNLIATGTAATPIASDGFNTWNNNKFINTSSTAGRFAVGNGADDLFINNEFISQAGFAVSHNGDSDFIGNYFHDSPTCYRYTGTAPVNLTHNIFANCPTAAISITAAAIAPVVINGNTIKGGNVNGIGVSVATGAGGIRLLNNIITDFATGVSATTANTNQYSNWNDFFSNTTARTNWTAGASDISTNPSFGSVAVISGASGSVSGSVLTDNSATFTVTDGVDYVMFISGTGLTVTPGSILISSHTTHTVTMASAPGGSGSNISYVIVTGHNFAVSPTMKRKGFPGLFNGSSTTGYLDLGAAQRYEYGRPLK